MKILETLGFEDYELIDSGDGYRLERFGKFIISRPDPQIIWKKKLSSQVWTNVDAFFKRTSADKGYWVKKNKQMPTSWQIKYKNLSFIIKLSSFKHTGLFPEQHLMWDFISNVILNASEESYSKDDKQPNILNLFAYTGAATLAAANSGAKVTHVDASKPTITWANENQKASHLEDRPIRWILDDAVKFVQREIKRGVKYDGLIMDPPVFGHGPDGKMWKFNEDFPNLLSLTKQLLSDHPLFIIVNAYAISSSSLMLKNVMEDYFSDLGGKFEVGELVLLEKTQKRPLSTGIFGRWSK